MKNKIFLMLFLRYFFLLVLGFNGLSFFYLILTPLTIHPVFFIISLFEEVSILQNIISFKGINIEIISACVAGSAYYLLTILNMTTPMKPKQRIKSLLFLTISFLFLNILRIIIFSYLAVYGFSYFDFAHKFVWYFGSTILVVLIWFTNVHIFKIKSIPIFTDFKTIFNEYKKK